MNDAFRDKANVAEQISRGNLNVDIKVLSNEDVLGKSMVSMKESISTTVKDIQLLTEAAVVGKLDTRANVTRHSGEFAKIISGINNTLDEIISPIKEASGVLENVATRNLTQKMSGNYKGDHAQIKNSLNSSIANLDQALSQVSISAEQVN